MWYPQVTIAFNTKNIYSRIHTHIYKALYGRGSSPWCLNEHPNKFQFWMIWGYPHGKAPSSTTSPSSKPSASVPSVSMASGRPTPLQKRCSQLLPSALQLQESVLYYYIYILIYYIYTTLFMYLIYFSYYFCYVQAPAMITTATPQFFSTANCPPLRLFRLRIVHLRLHLVPRNPTAENRSTQMRQGHFRM